MDLTAALSLVGLLFVTLLALTAGYVVILLLLEHAKYDHLPGPKRTSFFFGNLSQLMNDARSPQDSINLPTDHLNLKPPIHVLLAQWCEKYGDTYVLFIIHKVMVVTRSRNFLKTVLVDSDPRDFPKAKENAIRYLYGERYLAEGLATVVDHDAWYLRRRVLDPMFHRNKLKMAISTFNTSADRFITELQTYAESGETCKLMHLIEQATLDIIMKTMFSTDDEDFSTDFHKEAAKFVTEGFAALQYSTTPFIRINPFFYNHIRSIRKLLRSFRHIGRKIISSRKSAICNDEIVPDDMLSAIIRAHLDPATGYDFDILVDEFVTMIVAGMETTGNTLAFIFMELGRRPDLIHRLVREVDEVVGQKSFISNDDITKLAFTTTLIKEALRQHAIVPTLLRVAQKETNIDGLCIPAGTDILCNIFGANNDKRYVENPDHFDPDRFDPKQEKRVSVYSFLSFSLGFRNCIGQVFAQMEMKVVLAKFFQQYTFQLDSSETFHRGQRATHFPISGVKCTISHRR